MVERLRRVRHLGLVAPAAALSLLVLPATTPVAPPDTDADTDADTAAPTSASPSTESTESVDDLYLAARAEGQVNLIGLPPDWVNYGEIIASFGATFPGVVGVVQSPNSSSADQLAAVEAQLGSPDMPDVLDIGPNLDVHAIDPATWSPYRPTVWDDVPAALRDPGGDWIAGYFGVVAIATNTGVVADAPTTFAELRDPRYAGQVTLTGDPTEDAGAFAVVMAASLANGGTLDDVRPGIEYFADLRDAGILADPPTEDVALDPTTTPIVLDWSYDVERIGAGEGERGEGTVDEAGTDTRWAVAADGLYGAFYAQGIVAGGPHPNAARLWIEHVLSDESAADFLAAGAFPARLEALATSDDVDLSMLGGVAPSSFLDRVQFASAEQVAAALDVVVENWGPMVMDHATS